MRKALTEGKRAIAGALKGCTRQHVMVCAAPRPVMALPTSQVLAFWEPQWVIRGDLFPMYIKQPPLCACRAHLTPRTSTKTTPEYTRLPAIRLHNGKLELVKRLKESWMDYGDRCPALRVLAVNSRVVITVVKDSDTVTSTRSHI